MNAQEAKHAGTTEVKPPQPSPPWTEPDAALRYVFEMPGQTRYCMVKLPAEPQSGELIERLEAVYNGRPLPVRVVDVTPSEISVIVNATYVKGGSPVVLYAFTGTQAVEVGAEGPLDPAPILGEVRRVSGQDFPQSWASHQFQRRRFGEAIRTFRAVSFDHAQRESNPGRWRRDEWSRTGYCVEFITWLRIPESGEYRFAVKGSGAVFLILGEDERPVVEHTHQLVRLRNRANYEGDASEWKVGDPVRLEAGVYPMRTVQIARMFSNAMAGWVMPGRDGEPEPIPTQFLMAGQPELPMPRGERADAVVQAGIELDIGEAYQFHGIEGVFAPVKLRANSVDWMGGELTHRWFVDGVERELDADGSLVMIAGRHQVELRSRNTLGFEGIATRSVNIPTVAAQEYRITGSLEGVAAICYDEDRVWPDIWLRGQVPRDMRFDASLAVRLRDGRVRRLRDSVGLVRTWGQLRGDEIAVEDVEAVEWAIRHGDAVLAEQEVRFLRQPFETLPDRVRGDSLMVGGSRIVLVVRRRAEPDSESADLSRGWFNWLGRRGGGTAPRSSILAGAQRIVCLDSTLAPRGRYAAEADSAYDGILAAALSAEAGSSGPPPVERVPYESLIADEEGSLRTLAPLAGLADFRAGDVVVLSLGLEAYAERETIGMFERRVAGLCALLREAAGAEVVLVTPPPLGGDRQAIRPYAEAIMRVADAYRIEVADTYSAFAGHAARERLFDELHIPREGQMLAASIIMRTLKGENRANAN